MALFCLAGRACSCSYRIAREEQALLAVSAILSLIRRLACSPRLQRGLRCSPVSLLKTFFAELVNRSTSRCPTEPWFGRYARFCNGECRFSQPSAGPALMRGTSRLMGRMGSAEQLLLFTSRYRALNIYTSLRTLWLPQDPEITGIRMQLQPKSNRSAGRKLNS